jgi:hypothetical protein
MRPMSRGEEGCEETSRLIVAMPMRCEEIDRHEIAPFLM